MKFSIDKNTNKQLCSEHPIKMLIVGGAGGMGRWFTELFAKRGIKVTICDLNTPPDDMAEAKSRTIKAIDTLSAKGVKNVRWIEYDGVNVPETTNIAEYDVIVISVPIEKVNSVIKIFAPRMKPGALLFDITSIKEEPVNEMIKYAPEKVSILGTHPLFAYSVLSIVRQTIVFTEVQGKCNPYWKNWLSSLLRESGAIVVECSPQEHDQMMAVVQILTHFCYISIGKTLKEWGVNLKESYRLKTPVYEVLYAFVGRIFSHDAKIYYGIQMSPLGKDIRNFFIKQCRELANIADCGNPSEFTEQFLSIKQFFGDNLPLAFASSARIIKSATEDRNRLLSSKGHVRGIKNIETGKLHFGVIQDITDDLIVMLVDDNVRKIKLRKIELLSEEEEHNWKKANLSHHIRDVSVMVLKKIDPEIILDLFQSDKRIISVEIIDKYEGKQICKGYVGITYRFKIIGDIDPDQVIEEVNHQLVRIGCKKRGFIQEESFEKRALFCHSHESGNP